MDAIISDILVRVDSIDISNLNIVKFLEKVKISRKKYSIKSEEIDKLNYDKKICDLYGNYYTLDEIMLKNLKINELVGKFYGILSLDSNFISTRVLRNILNSLNKCINFKNEKRDITIYYDNKKDIKIKVIDSILNFLDYFTGNENVYNLIIYLSDEPKKLNNKLDHIGPDNVNSGYSIHGHHVCIWRKEELEKVLFHEMVHQLDLHMINYQYLFGNFFSKINLDSKFLNSNEAYTEVLGLFLLYTWKFHYFNFSKLYKLEDFLTKCLNVQLAWSYYQMAKILKFFKCFKKYDDIFDKNINCLIKEKSNVVAYYFLKTYFLKRIDKLFNFMSEGNVFISLSEVKKFKNNLDLHDDTGKIVDFIFNNISIDDDTMKMSYLM